MTSVRQATITDLSRILHWTLELHSHEDDGNLKVHEKFKTNLQRWLEVELSNTNNLMLIAEENSMPIGFVSGSSTFNDNGFLAAPLKGTINLLWVEAPHRKKNIASMLVTQLEECLASIGVSYIECNYTTNNNLAKVFWSSRNYAPSSITARKLLAATS